MSHYLQKMFRTGVSKCVRPFHSFYRCVKSRITGVRYVVNGSFHSACSPYVQRPASQGYDASDNPGSLVGCWHVSDHTFSYAKVDVVPNFLMSGAASVSVLCWCSAINLPRVWVYRPDITLRRNKKSLKQGPGALCL